MICFQLGKKEVVFQERLLLTGALVCVKLVAYSC